MSSVLRSHQRTGSDTPSWCTVVSVLMLERQRETLVSSVRTGVVFSSVLREFPRTRALKRSAVGFRREGPWSRGPGEPPPHSSPLRTAEQARASLILPSYKEPTVDALAPRTDEGRGRLRKATGSCLPSVNPWMSEWGNPALVMECYSCLNT